MMEKINLLTVIFKPYHNDYNFTEKKFRFQKISNLHFIHERKSPPHI